MLVSECHAGTHNPFIQPRRVLLTFFSTFDSCVGCAVRCSYLNIFANGMLTLDSFLFYQHKYACRGRVGGKPRVV